MATIKKNPRGNTMTTTMMEGNRRTESKISWSLSSKMNTTFSTLSPTAATGAGEATINTTTTNLVLPYQPPNFCALPGQHQHWADNLSERSQHLVNFIELLQEPLGEEALSINSSSQTTGSMLTAEQRQPLDPYIDAVLVRHRINNRRGERVKAASLMRPQQQQLHQPSSSYLSPKKHHHHHGKDEWYSSDDDSDDEDGGHVKKVKKVYVQEVAVKGGGGGKMGHHHHGHHHGKGKGRGRGRGGKRGKGYGKAHYYIKLGGGGHHHHHHGKGSYGTGGGYKKGGGGGYGGKRGGQKKVAKKVTYAYIYHSKPVQVHHEQGYEHKEHYGHQGKGGHGYSSGYDKSSYDKSSYHSSYGGGHNKPGYGGGKHHHGLDSGKFNMAGLLGYTLLCLNYLLLMHEPSGGHSKYGGGYSKYSPHGGSSHHHGSPVILAHCGELPAPKSLMKMHSHDDYHHKKHSKAPDEVTVVKLVTSGSEQQPTRVSLNATSATSNATSSRILLPAAASPPQYYFTRSPVNLNAGDPPAGLFGPVQSYLNRLLLSQEREQLELARPPVVVGRPPQRLRLFESEVETGGQDGSRRMRLSLDAAVPPSRLILVDQQQAPQLVRSRNNLVRVSERRSEIGVRVRHRNRFAGRARPVNVIEAQLGPLQLAIQAPNGLVAATNNATATSSDERELMQNDQPSRVSTSTTESGNNRNMELEREQQIVDLPEFALAGDTIELTCNHRLPLTRLYSVKWFKDSLEFYRFIPANGPRTKSSLFLPDVRLDLARSNAESLYLRNVSHRSGGLYRCEAVSEGPNFETVSGEKRMQVYSLPEQGPQLGLLDGGDLAMDSPLAASLRQLEREQPEVDTDGPIVRCLSARSSPAAQLALYINNRPLAADRALENSTLAYSDGLEANVVSFKLRLADFLYDSGAIGGGLVKAAATPESQKLEPATNSSSTTTTTSTTTTRKPRADKAEPTTANAGVQFDADFRLDKAEVAQQRAERRRKAPSPRERASGDADGEEAESAPSPAAISRPLPLGGGGDERKDKAAERKSGGGGLANINLETDRACAASTGRRPVTSLGANQQLFERRRAKRQASGSAASSANAAPKQQQQQQVYSNYIRIKCTSLVAAVGYEMTSELSAPLTLLVPARQLSDASSSSPGGRASARGASSAGAREDAAANQAPAEDDDGGTGRAGAARPIRNGGSLQAPRAVLIDRLAQASAAPAAKALAPPPSSPQNATSSSRPTASSNSSSNNGTSSNSTTAGGGSRARARGQGVTRDRALEQRAKYLEELGKLGKARPASSGRSSSAASSQLGPMRSMSVLHHQLILTLLVAGWLWVTKFGRAKEVE